MFERGDGRSWYSITWLGGHLGWEILELDIRSGGLQLGLLTDCVGLCHMLLKSKTERHLRLRNGTTREGQWLARCNMRYDKDVRCLDGDPSIF